MRLGLFGGRFDPPHFGHLLLAEQAREALRLEEVWFIPSGDPPHKAARAPAEQRAAMTALATGDHPAFRTRRLELERSGPSYAIDTVAQIGRERPDAELWYLIGADAFAEIDTWHRAEALLERVRMAVLPRPDSAASPAPEPFRARARHLQAIPFGVSSSAVRERAAQGRSLRYLVPEPVAAHLRRHGLYGSAGAAGRSAGSAGAA